ncbi:hypothetical protein F4774DRAFT_395658 [Daldinia eschscholtzii]|nr:hypothetical protein F4774DRAFT_395658 [Daldinia eschscholtzii]
MPSTRRGVFQKNPEENESAVTPRTQRNHMSTPKIIPHLIPSHPSFSSTESKKYAIRYHIADNKGKNSKPKPSLTARLVPTRKKTNRNA